MQQLCIFRGNSVHHILPVLTQATEEDRKAFHLFGVLCGLALYNHNVIQLPFPLALFKKLVNAKLTLDDMKEFQPSVGRSVHSTLRVQDASHDLSFISLFESVCRWHCMCNENVSFSDYSSFELCFKVFGRSLELR